MSGAITSTDIFALERPDPSLRTLYVLRSVLTGPFLVVLLPISLFRYRTLRYRFDEEGIHMRVGILFRKEVNLTYARIQDIHLQSGILQRWLGLADIHIQTASGSSGAELVIEGFKEFESIRDFLYARMRGAHGDAQGTAAESTDLAPALPGQPEGAQDVVGLLLSIRDELRQTRELLEQQRGSTAEGEPSRPDV
jgi:putative membrane protein